jgi:hypothetical protein
MKMTNENFSESLYEFKFSYMVSVDENCDKLVYMVFLSSIILSQQFLFLDNHGLLPFLTF